MTSSYSVVADRTAWSESGEGLVVLDLQDSTYLSFNGTAAVLWRQLAAGPVGVAELEQSLRVVYQVEPEQARADVADFLAQLVQRGLVAQHVVP